MLTTKCNMSRKKVCDLVEETFGLKISSGTLSNQERYFSEALKHPVLQLQEWLKTQDTLYVELCPYGYETSWRESSKKHWAWTASGSEGTVFQIAPGRSRVSLKSLVILQTFTTSAFRGSSIPFTHTQYLNGYNNLN